MAAERKTMIFRKHVRSDLPAYLDGEGRAADRIRLEAHLQHCTACRAKLEYLRACREALLQLPVERAPEGLWEKIESAAESAVSKSLPAASAWQAWRLAWPAAIAAAVIFCWWMWPRHTSGIWKVVATAGSPVSGAQRLKGTVMVPSGRWVETDMRSRARISIGAIGTVDLAPNTHIELVSTETSAHRLALRNGAIEASISAPPRLFFVDTPAGTAVDLGCEYKLECSRDGNGLLRVTSGWVAFEWSGRESLVPAGASCRLYGSKGPGTPWFDDASPAFILALQNFDQRQAGALSTLLTEARARDTLSLWHLFQRIEKEERLRLYTRIASFTPPPADLSQQRILDLDHSALLRWKEELAWTW